MFHVLAFTQEKTMKFGVNLLLFGDQVTSEVRDNFSQIRDIGFDGVEIPVFDPESTKTDEIRDAAEQAGLELTVSGALPPGTNFYTDDAEPFIAAKDYITKTIDTAAALGASVICGPLYKAVGEMDESIPLSEQRARTVEAMKPLLAYAEEKGVVLAFEPLNRFETNFMNIEEQGTEFCKKAGSSSAGLLLDTFHMHIEEKNTPAAVETAGKAGTIAHFHAAENDRGVAGTGQVHWEPIAQALKDSGYDKWVVLESFNQTCEAIRTAVSCWRPFYPDEEAFMKEGLTFVKKLFG